MLSGTMRAFTATVTDLDQQSVNPHIPRQCIVCGSTVETSIYLHLQDKPVVLCSLVCLDKVMTEHEVQA